MGQFRTAPDLTERFQRTRNIIRGDANAGIDHLDRDPALRVDRRYDANIAVIVRELDGVGQQIDQNLADQPIVSLELGEPVGDVD